MVWFFIVYCLIFGSLHFIVFRKVQKALRPGRGPMVAVGLWMVLMILGPVIIRVAERLGVEQAIHLASRICFSWMGVSFLFLMLYLLVDLLALARFLLPTAGREMMALLLERAGKKIFYLILLLSSALFVYGLFEAADLQTRMLRIYSPKISAQQGRIRIVQVSDVHLGLLVAEERLAKIVELIDRQQGDILVSTGDLVDGQPNHLVGAEAIFRSLPPSMAKIAVTGNHEFYAGLEHSLQFTEDAGFTILRHQGISVNGINIVGLDDQAYKRFAQGPRPKEHELLAAQDPDNFTILLKHLPIIEPESIGLFDLQLSGHTHKGQIFPFNLLTYLFFPYPAARLVDLEQGQLYINPGAATWGPPIRLFARPEITVIDLLPAKAK